MQVLAKSQSLNAEEAMDVNLVDYVYSQDTVKSEALKYCEYLCSLPLDSDQLKRRIIKDDLIDILRNVNKMECEELERKCVSKESFHAIALYLESRNMRAYGMILR